jgi:hypothetical protein
MNDSAIAQGRVVGAARFASQAPYAASREMVRQGGAEDAEDDGDLAREPRGQHERKELRLVAHLGEGDDGG